MYNSGMAHLYDRYGDRLDTLKICHSLSNLYKYM